jgi:hypothetical protein
MAIRFSKLTRPLIRSLLAGGTITEHGITFRREPSGDGVYSINIMVGRVSGVQANNVRKMVPKNSA